jgi:hypothetical protein
MATGSKYMEVVGDLCENIFKERLGELRGLEPSELMRKWRQPGLLTKFSYKGAVSGIGSTDGFS